MLRSLLPTLGSQLTTLRPRLTMLRSQLGSPVSAVAARALWGAQLKMLGVCAGWRW
jgi:hypothetical protein